MIHYSKVFLFVFFKGDLWVYSTVELSMIESLSLQD